MDYDVESRINVRKNTCLATLYVVFLDATQLSPYFANVLIISAISPGPSCFLTNLDRLITSLMSPCCSHVSSAIIGAVSCDNLVQTLTAICRNCSGALVQSHDGGDTW